MLILLAVFMTTCVPSTLPIDYDNISQFRGESDGITVYVELKSSGNLVLPGDRYLVHLKNDSNSPIIFDYDNDTVLYYTDLQVFRGHMFRVGDTFPRFIKQGEVGIIGIMTDRKGLTIKGFEILLSDADIKVFAGVIEKED